MTLLAIFFAAVLLYSLVSGRLERTILTAPIIFTAAGVASSLLFPETAEREGSEGALLTIAEIGLVLLLFTDASRTDLGVLRRAGNIPARLLGIGLLGTIALGGVAAWLVFPGLSLAEAGILAAILAPTDAGLGQVIVQSPRVPERIRQALNVEAGLNDGLSVPFLLFFIALAGGGEEASLARFIGEQLGYGVLVGAGIGLAGGALLGIAHRRGAMAHGWPHLGVVALPILCILASEAAGASMFIAAFVAGLAVQIGYREAGKHGVELAEEWGQLFNLAVFFLFGLLAARAWPEFRPSHLLYAALSLTVVRMLPVALALRGARLARATVLFIGWFGPRGLASIVLGLVYLEEVAHPPGEPTIQLAVVLTVLASTILHGATALPGIALHERRLAARPGGAGEGG